MRITLHLATLVAALLFVGCENITNSGTASNSGTSHEHGEGSHEHTDAATQTHADGAACSCEHGPYNGHVLHFENKEYLGEWVVSKDNDVVRFYLLNANKEDSPIKVDSFRVTPLAGSDATPFELKAESAATDGKAHIYSVDSKDLRTSIPLGVKVEVKSGDLVLTGIVDAHEPHDH